MQFAVEVLDDPQRNRDLLLRDRRKLERGELLAGGERAWIAAVVRRSCNPDHAGNESDDVATPMSTRGTLNTARLCDE